MVNVWRLMAHHVKCCRLPMIQWATVNNRIAIGWSEVGDLFQPQYATPEDIQDQVNIVAQGQGPPAEAPTAGIQLWNFRGGAHPFHPGAHSGPHTCRPAMQCGDLVILKTDDKHGGWAQSVVMRVQGPYEYVPPGHVPDDQPPFGYRHQRKAVQVTGCSPKALWNAAHPIVPGQSIFNALVLCQFQVECQGGQTRRVNDVRREESR